MHVSRQAYSDAVVFKEEMQDLTDVDQSGVILSAKTQKVGTQEGNAEGTPTSSFMSDILKACPLVPSLSEGERCYLSKKKSRFGEISGLMKIS